MAAQPGSDIPSPSASEFIDSAVPIELQWPGLGADPMPISIISSAVIRPAANCRRASHSTIPEPAGFPFRYVSTIGPPESTIAGMFTVAAAIRHAGVVLSHAVVITIPSNG